MQFKWRMQRQQGRPGPPAPESINTGPSNLAHTSADAFLALEARLTVEQQQQLRKELEAEGTLSAPASMKRTADVQADTSCGAVGASQQSCLGGADGTSQHQLSRAQQGEVALLLSQPAGPAQAVM